MKGTILHNIFKIRIIVIALVIIFIVSGKYYYENSFRSFQVKFPRKKIFFNWYGLLVY